MFYPGKKLTKDNIEELTKQTSALIYGEDNLRNIPQVDVIEIFEKKCIFKERSYKQTGVFGNHSSYTMYSPRIKISYESVPFILKFILNKINDGWNFSAERVGKLPDISIDESFLIDISYGGITSIDKREQFIKEGYGFMHMRVLFKNINDIELSYRKTYTAEYLQNSDDYEKMFNFLGVIEKHKKQEIIDKLNNAIENFVYD